MAAGLIDVVVGRLVGMVLDQITNEASLFFNFRKDFEWLSEKLTNITSYLKDADVHSAHNQRVKRWLLRLADIAMDAEDILDECALQSLSTNNSTQSSCTVCPFNYSQLALRYKMGRRIKDVKDRLKTIMEDAAELKLVADLIHSDQASTSTSTSQNVKWKRSSMTESDARPVAIETKVEEILSLLYDPATPVIAVVGMGGVGKTFLLQNVFNRVKDRFDNSIWLAISQSYSVKQLQRDLAAKIRSADVNGRASEISLDGVVNGNVSEMLAAEFIHKQLENRRSLIVLDDVWRATGVDNLISTLGLPTGNNTQCRIVVSTRSRDVCRNMNARVYEMKPLLEEESSKLFCAFAFPDCEESRPPHHLHEIASHIEKECGRLPLAIKTVAASLEGKTTRDWESKLRQLKEVADRDDPIMEILKLSYDSLPVHLKPCFTYLSFFPEDEKIDPQYLINLWIAEGFIRAGEDQVEIGRDYIYHLHNLCLLEIVEDTDYDQTSKCCRVHDLLLDLAISISKESHCAFSVGEAFSNVSAIERSSDCRRFFLAKKSIADGEIASNGAYSASRLRTLSLSQNRGIYNIPANLFSGVRVLRVLDLSSTSISALPTCVGNFKLLRVLNLSGTQIKEVPESVRSIKSLRVLDISRCRGVQQLPVWIGELNCLEYLDIRWCGGECESRIPKGVSKLVSLQALRSTGGMRLASNNEGDNELLKVEHLVNLVNLREVQIDVGDVEVLKRIEEGILAPLANMRHLRLGNRVETVNYDEESNLPPLSEKMLDMKDLEILYLLEFAVPRWICGFSNLMQLGLWRCHCADYPALQTMPNLISLEMWYNNKCRVLPKGFGKARGFLFVGGVGRIRGWSDATP